MKDVGYRNSSVCKSKLTLKKGLSRVYNSVCVLVLSTMLVFGTCKKKSSAEEYQWLPVTEQVNGTLSEIEGIPILRLWGTNYEQGYAYGYLMGPEIVSFIDAILESRSVGINNDVWENQFLKKLDLMVIKQKYKDELRGMLAGIRARKRGAVESSSLRRALKYEDLVILNCTQTFLRMACSSFAAWGKLTGDGNTITGRNLDFDRNYAMQNTRQIIVVHVPPAGENTPGWVNCTWPGFVGCVSGMNADGFTIAPHSAYGDSPSLKTGFNPLHYITRTAIESISNKTSIQSLEGILEKNVSVIGCNIFCTKPHTDESTNSIVFEIDGNLTIDQGVTTREPENQRSYQIVTNHFRKRSKPMSDCHRYNLLSNWLSKIARSGGAKHLTTELAWKLLRKVPCRGLITYQSIVFEPNKRLIHVAFSEKRKHAPLGKIVTLNVRELISGNISNQ